VVKASITGSIIGNVQLVFGVSILAGGISLGNLVEKEYCERNAMLASV